MQFVGVPFFVFRGTKLGDINHELENAESLANKTDLRRSLFVDYYKAMRKEGWLLLLDEDRPVAIGLLGLGEYLVSL